MLFRPAMMPAPSMWSLSRAKRYPGSVSRASWRYWGFGASAFPPVEVADGGEDGCCVFGAGEGVGVGEELFCPFDP